MWVSTMSQLQHPALFWGWAFWNDQPDAFISLQVSGVKGMPTSITRGWENFHQNAPCWLRGMSCHDAITASHLCCKQPSGLLASEHDILEGWGPQKNTPVRAVAASSHYLATTWRHRMGVIGRTWNTGWKPFLSAFLFKFSVLVGEVGTTPTNVERQTHTSEPWGTTDMTGVWGGYPRNLRFTGLFFIFPDAEKMDKKAGSL